MNSDYELQGFVKGEGDVEDINICIRIIRLWAKEFKAINSKQLGEEDSK